jgi:hypothetical protein
MEYQEAWDRDVIDAEFWEIPCYFIGLPLVGPLPHYDEDGELGIYFLKDRGSDSRITVRFLGFSMNSAMERFERYVRNHYGRDTGP